MKYLQTAKLTIEDRIIDLRSVLKPGGLDFDFSITKKRFETNAEISLTIYNAGQDTLKALSKKSPLSNLYNISKIKCEAGYEGDNKLIFSGTVFTTNTDFYPQGKISVVEVSSYSQNLLESRGQISSKTSPRLLEALNRLGSQIGVTIDSSNFLPQDNLAISQTSFEGTILDFLTKEASSSQFQDKKGQGCIFSFEANNDAISIESVNRTVAPIPEKFINTNTGMILTPSLNEQNLVVVKSLFDPDYKIRQFVQTDSTKYAQPTVQGEIWQYSHTFTYTGSTSEIQILPLGQNVPLNNIGIKRG